MFADIVEGNALLAVVEARGKFGEAVKSRPGGMVGLQLKRRIGLLPSYDEHCIGRLPRLRLRRS